MKTVKLTVAIQVIKDDVPMGEPLPFAFSEEPLHGDTPLDRSHAIDRAMELMVEHLESDDALAKALRVLRQS